MLAAFSWMACVHHPAAPTPGGALAVAVGANEGYVALGEAGYATFDLKTGALGPVLPPPAPMASVDDLSLLNEVLALLDARAPGAVALALPAEGLRLSGGPVEVELAGPAGLSSHHGVVGVAGGGLTVLTYDGRGALHEARSTGAWPGPQADLLLHHSGERAYLFGALEDGRGGLSMAQLQAPPADPLAVATLPLCAPGGVPHGEGWDALLFLGCDDGITVVDVGAFDAPAVRGRLALGPGVLDAAVELDRAYALRPGELIELDAADPTQLRVRERIPLPADAIPHDLAVRKGTVYVAAGPAGVLVFPRREAPDATRAQ